MTMDGEGLREKAQDLCVYVCMGWGMLGHVSSPDLEAWATIQDI